MGMNKKINLLCDCCGRTEESTNRFPMPGWNVVRFRFIPVEDDNPKISYTDIHEHTLLCPRCSVICNGTLKLGLPAESFFHGKVSRDSDFPRCSQDCGCEICVKSKDDDHCDDCYDHYYAQQVDQILSSASRIQKSAERREKQDRR